MDKKLKKQLQQAPGIFRCIYDHKTIEREADKGFKHMLEALKDSLPESSHDALETDTFKHIFSLVYYSCFEHAYNTFLRLELRDLTTELELEVNEFCNITANIKQNNP
ncbi:MAG: hypothetical protein K6A96_10985 [Prevotella sp.]|nr:hypothetical protein [Prevotella sp.]